MEGVSGTNSMGINAIEAMKKGREVQEMQAAKALESAVVQNKESDNKQKSSELAAQSTGLGVNINIKG